MVERHISWCVLHVHKSTPANCLLLVLGCEVYLPAENHTVVVSPVGSGSPPSCLGGVVQLAWCYCCFVLVCARLVFFVLFFGIVWVSCIQRCCSAAWAATCATNNLRLTLHLSPSPSFFECVFFRTRNFNFWIVEPRLSFSGANLCTLLVLLLIYLYSFWKKPHQWILQ